MGRPSKLTESQKKEITDRMASGETQRALADEFKVSVGTINKLFNGRSETIKTLAKAKASVDSRIQLLNISEQVIVFNMAEQFKAMQHDYTRGAAAGLDTATHLHEMANKKAKGLSAGTVETEDLRIVAALTETANKAAAMGTNLINAMKPKVEDESSEDLTKIPEKELKERALKLLGMPA